VDLIFDLEDTVFLKQKLEAKMKTIDYLQLTAIQDKILEKSGIQVFPQASEHVNDHATCLHLWCCLEADVLPDFSCFGTV